MFYLPKTIYQNLKTLAKENNISIDKQIRICLEYARENPPEKNKIKQIQCEQLKYMDTVHFTGRYSSTALKQYIEKNNLTPIEIVNALNYGQYYKEIEERRALCQKYKLN